MKQERKNKLKPMLLTQKQAFVIWANCDGLQSSVMYRLFIHFGGTSSNHYKVWRGKRSWKNEN